MEEDIKILEEIKQSIDTDYGSGRRKVQAIDNLINRNKELEENIKKQKQLTKLAQTITDESLKEALIEFEKDYIPKSKIKEKIEEYFEDEEWLIEHDLRALCDDEKECREYYLNKKIALKDIKKAILDKLDKLLKNC